MAVWSGQRLRFGGGEMMMKLDRDRPLIDAVRAPRD